MRKRENILFILILAMFLGGCAELSRAMSESQVNAVVKEIVNPTDTVHCYSDCDEYAMGGE